MEAITTFLSSVPDWAYDLAGLFVLFIAVIIANKYVKKSESLAAYHDFFDLFSVATIFSIFGAVLFLLPSILIGINYFAEDSNINPSGFQSLAMILLIPSIFGIFIAVLFMCLKYISIHFDGNSF